MHADNFRNRQAVRDESATYDAIGEDVTVEPSRHSLELLTNIFRFVGRLRAVGYRDRCLK